MTFQVVARFTNTESLCICEISGKEAEIAMQDAPFVDGYGLYLVSVDAQNPKKPGTVLAKFASVAAATKLANLFVQTGRIEYAA